MSLPEPLDIVDDRSAGQRIRDWAEGVLADLNPDALFFEGPGDSDRAIIGIATKGPSPAAVVYDQDRLVATMVEAFRDADGDQDPEEAAWEWLEFNTKGAWMGEGTPWVLIRPSPEALEPDPPGLEPDQAHFG